MSDQAYVVMATQGEDDDLDVWPVAVYADEALAQKHAEAAEAWANPADYPARPWMDYKGRTGWVGSPYDAGLELICPDSPVEYHVEPVPLRTALPVVEGGGETA